MRYHILSALAASVAIAAPAATSYDYIVVGSGPGGGPLAADLARAGYSTLLIEAGGDEGENPTYSDIPNFNEAANDELTRWDFWVKHSDDPERDLKFQHTTWDTGDGTFYVGLDPPEDAKLLGIQYPRAAVLGGCAMHNAGVCALPADDDWNIIVNKTGDESWSAENMRKYFKKIERNEYLPAGDETHGYEGWLATSVADNSWATNTSLPGTKILRKLAELTNQDPDAAADLVNRDINEATADRDETSSFYNMVTHASAAGKRSSPNNYVRATLADPAKYPLTVQLHTLVTRVLFDNATVPRAIGVEVMEGASLYKADPKHVAGTTGPLSQILATREVIVAGGAFNSPQILKLSGIGPAAELAAFNIPLVKDLPGVGENLGDNYEGSLLALGAAPVDSGLITLLFRTPSAPTAKRNIFTWCGAFSFEGFWPGFPTYHGPTQYTCALVHMAPKSQAGTVRLVSADPQDKPEINFRFYERHGEQDLHELVEAADLLREAWKAAGEPVLPLEELHPCPAGEEGPCDEAKQAEYFKLQAYSHHATSTCAIGGDDEPLAVLDSKFRVRGVAGLRVVDASAFPVVPGAFPSCPTMMLSAKAAEDILADAKAAERR
ncbi:hypothetical protein CHGG_11065 [Chaetomium globosum CBS 148.51]|uniref:Glucose-methanol-choline oxidoreductase N-terminal domain-containing protein n=1 Tax=Chaetomium globosum (strain ATCC 6205 / CBS 148.51 / DSM 1962 / NBRC 6347 / NRRL 1970) TaxID=306901 RepID=Q2GLZ1_CHAGB|nr:uncharacterized protein CHGG_11065 [Chaetomium globosum CBS 148.51]EAQ82889.1 hypothetical protein CHGG_11065 [Chaetomium globosum CBS 148.51]